MLAVQPTTDVQNDFSKPPSLPFVNTSLHNQVQLSKCVSERDHALFEADEIRSLLVKAESGYKEERARAESEAVARASLNQQLSSLREQIKKHELEIESLSKECENSGRKMRQAAEEKRRLESASKDLRVMRIV